MSNGGKLFIGLIYKFTCLGSKLNWEGGAFDSDSIPWDSAFLSSVDLHNDIFPIYFY